MKNVALTRSELHQLVWAMPMQQLSKQVGMSDVGLAKQCRKNNIPLPPRGYWAKLQAGQKLVQTGLPPRELGEADGGVVTLNLPNDIIALLPERRDDGVLRGDLEQMTQRFRKRLGKVTVPRDLTAAHPNIRKYLEKDELHRQKKKTDRWYFYSPVFDTPFELRRLRILNAMFLAFARMGWKPWARGENAREIGVVLPSGNLSFKLDAPTGRIIRTIKSNVKAGCLSIEITTYQPPADATLFWHETEDSNFETRLTEIMVEMAISVEKIRRKHSEDHLIWLRKRAEEEEANNRRRLEEAARLEKERLLAIEQAKIDRLLNEADDFHRANIIRDYANKVKIALADQANAVSLNAWVGWALQHADKLDPVASGRAAAAIKDLSASDYE